MTFPFSMVAGCREISALGFCGPRTAASFVCATKEDNGVIVPATTRPPAAIARIISRRDISFDMYQSPRKTEPIVSKKMTNDQ
jgi:hypothetical protein